MKKIICKFDIFDLYQSILLMDNNKFSLIKESSIDSLINDIIDISNELQVFNIHFFGNETYIKKFKEDVLLKNKNLKVEVN